MTTKEFVALEKFLLPKLPSFAIKGRLMLIVPITHTLRGFHFDPSGFSKKDFYVDVFFMPLCVPTKHIHLTFGHRIGSSWSARDPNLKTALATAMQSEIPFIAPLESSMDVASALKPFIKRSNPHSHEAFAYTLIQTAATGNAVDALDALLRLIDPGVPWQQEILSRTELIKTKLLQSVHAAQQQLAIWEAETIHNLGLEEFLKQGVLNTHPMSRHWTG